MLKKEFIDTGLIAHITSEVMLKLLDESGLKLKQVTETMPQSYTYVWNRLNGGKGSYQMYEDLCVAL